MAIKRKKKSSSKKKKGGMSKGKSVKVAAVRKAKPSGAYRKTGKKISTRRRATRRRR
tara:strand:+ start:108 stop:278 length:171 start_codon:yes stop_codon:yes gene_type:complete